jgi:signal peptidase
MKRLFKIFSNIVLALLIVLLVAIAATFIPIPGNYRVYTVQSGSMEPKIKMGSLIFVKPAGDYGVGDVVTIKAGKNTVTHRVVEKNNSGGEVTFRVKGDANEEADPNEIKKSEIIGREFFALPYIGYPVGYAKTGPGFIFLVIIPSVIIIYEEIFKIRQEIGKKIAKRKENKEGHFASDPSAENRIKIIGYDRQRPPGSRHSDSGSAQKTPPKRFI